MASITSPYSHLARSVARLAMLSCCPPTSHSHLNSELLLLSQPSPLHFVASHFCPVSFHALLFAPVPLIFPSFSFVCFHVRASLCLTRDFVCVVLSSMCLYFFRVSVLSACLYRPGLVCPVFSRPAGSVVLSSNVRWAIQVHVPATSASFP